MKKILIVDDEEDIRETLKEAFEDEGFVVETAANGALALKVLDQAPQDFLLLLDIVMPVMNGAELYERMRRDARFAKVQIIITTSDPSRAPSGVMVMKKPLDLGRLIDVVRGMLSARPA